ncbi:hypothetical protein IWX92DRAFT_223081 [Phyllosticta citricarpa]
MLLLLLLLLGLEGDQQRRRTHTPWYPRLNFASVGVGTRVQVLCICMYHAGARERARSNQGPKKKKKKKKGREKMQCDNRLRLPRTHHRLSPKLTRAVFLSSFFQVDGQVGPTPPTALHAVWW